MKKDMLYWICYDLCSTMILQSAHLLWKFWIILGSKMPYHKDMQGQFYNLFRSEYFATLPYIMEVFLHSLRGSDRNYSRTSEQENSSLGHDMQCACDLLAKLGAWAFSFNVTSRMVFHINSFSVQPLLVHRRDMLIRIKTLSSKSLCSVVKLSSDREKSHNSLPSIWFLRKTSPGPACLPVFESIAQSESTCPSSSKALSWLKLIPRLGYFLKYLKICFTAVTCSGVGLLANCLTPR